MLQQDAPEDCRSPKRKKARFWTLTAVSLLAVVLATNETHPIREFIIKAFEVVDIQLRWEGEGVNEVAIDTKTGKAVVRIDEK